MAPTAMVISDEERAAVDVLIKGAVLEKAAFKGVEPVATKIQGFAWNYHKDDKNLKLSESYEWTTGPSVPSYLDVICPSKFGQPQIFTHQAPSSPGTTACIVYADGDWSNARQWLVAFDTLNNLVYVEAGPLGPIDWQEVLEKLMSIESGPVSEYEDPIFHGKASAEIRQENGIYLLFVRFSN